MTTTLGLLRELPIIQFFIISHTILSLICLVFKVLKILQEEVSYIDAI